jgi:hypothetical protein
MTSFPILKANKLSYPEKALIVLIYSFRREVVQAGEALLIDPFKGREISSLLLFSHPDNPDKPSKLINYHLEMESANSQNIDSGITKCLHACIVVVLWVDTVDSQGVYAECLHLREISSTVCA